MEEAIKNIISQYIKIPAEQITAQTVIDRTGVASSVIIHRMYAQLATKGFIVADYTSVKTFGQLSSILDGKEIITAAEAITTEASFSAAGNNESSIGIDVEMISTMPPANDYREEAFYKMNFAPAEIAYCILQPNPVASFAGLFAAKEAIVKADNIYKNKPFHSIVIDHLPTGKPVYPGFQISISHTADTAIAVAVKQNTASPFPLAATSGNSTFIAFSAAAALLLSLLTFILFIFKGC